MRTSTWGNGLPTAPEECTRPRILNRAYAKEIPSILTTLANDLAFRMYLGPAWKTPYIVITRYNQISSKVLIQQWKLAWQSSNNHKIAKNHRWWKLRMWHLYLYFNIISCYVLMTASFINASVMWYWHLKFTPCMQPENVLWLKSNTTSSKPRTGNHFINVHLPI